MIKERIDFIRSKIADSADKCGRSVEDILLLAVTKTHEVSTIREGIKYGLTCIAENKIQESLIKVPELKNEIDEFHFIGHLQSNKIRKLMTLKPTLIHSLDKLSTIEKLNSIARELGVVQDILIQVNTSGEESKSGIEPEETINFIKQAVEFSDIRIRGLMTIGMFTSDKDVIRNCFRKLKKLYDEASLISGVDFRYLSMGMSGDFDIAIEEGANILRVGSAIFGARDYSL